MGPITHKEKCISVSVTSQLQESSGGMLESWCLLTGDQLEAVCQEAQKLADQLQSGELSQLHSEDDKSTDMTTDTTSNKEEFVQDAEAKLGVLGQTASTLSPIKRQTFCVQDSPMKQLPPAVQQRLLRGNSSNAASSTRHASANTNSFTRPAASVRRSISSPMAGVKAQPRTGLRGKATLGVVLPSKPAAPATSSSVSKSRVEKTRLQPPSKVREKISFLLSILRCNI